MNAEVATRAAVLQNYSNFYPHYYIGNIFYLCFVFQTHNWTKELPGQNPSVSMHITRLGSASLYIFLSTNAHWRNEEQVSEREAKMNLGLKAKRKLRDDDSTKLKLRASAPKKLSLSLHWSARIIGGRDFVALHT